MKTLHITASRKSDILIENGLLDALGAHAAETFRGRRTAVVSDSRVAPLYMERALASLNAAGFEAEPFVFPAGETSKCGATYLALVEFLAQIRLTRADGIIALGGGVTGDLTGFAAATFLRGVSLIQVPTTLLACVDSSVGGKTAIDLSAGKNLVGTFYQPNRVLCDPLLLKTLPEEVFSEGCAEVIKYGMYGNEALLRRLIEAPVHAQTEDVIYECIKMKQDIVESDEFDTGLRQYLNFGHTFAHSVEALSDYRIPHGQAVAIGMTIITRAAVKKRLCPESCLDVLIDLLKKHRLPCETEYTPEALAERALSDKKRAADRITLVVPTAPGKSELKSVPVTELIDWARAGVEA